MNALDRLFPLPGLYADTAETLSKHKEKDGTPNFSQTGDILDSAKPLNRLADSEKPARRLLGQAGLCGQVLFLDVIERLQKKQAH